MDNSMRETAGLVGDLRRMHVLATALTAVVGEFGITFAALKGAAAGWNALGAGGRAATGAEAMANIGRGYGMAQSAGRTSVMIEGMAAAGRAARTGEVLTHTARAGSASARMIEGMSAAGRAQVAGTALARAGALAEFGSRLATGVRSGFGGLAGAMERGGVALGNALSGGRSITQGFSTMSGTGPLVTSLTTIFSSISKSPTRTSDKASFRKSSAT